MNFKISCLVILLAVKVAFAQDGNKKHKFSFGIDAGKLLYGVSNNFILADIYAGYELPKNLKLNFQGFVLNSNNYKVSACVTPFKNQIITTRLGLLYQFLNTKNGPALEIGSNLIVTNIKQTKHYTYYDFVTGNEHIDETRYFSFPAVDVELAYNIYLRKNFYLRPTLNSVFAISDKSQSCIYDNGIINSLGIHGNFKEGLQNLNGFALYLCYRM